MLAKQELDIRLEQVNRHNWRAVLQLAVGGDQRDLICDNATALAEVGVRDEASARAILLSGSVVGLIVYLRDPESGDYYIHRMMVDEKCQGIGVGTRALRECIREISVKGDYSGSIYIMFLSWNRRAEEIYSAIGFTDTGDVHGDEKVFRLMTS